jgi:hypothetical protein
MSMQDAKRENALPEELRAALDAYGNARTADSWTALSQCWVRDDVTVFDAVKLLAPSFPDPLPLPVEGVVEDNTELYQWPTLPEPDDVLRAIVLVLQRRDA